MSALTSDEPAAVILNSSAKPAAAPNLQFVRST